MKIALVSTPFLAVPPRDYGGTELVVHELAEGLHARGHQVTLFATGDSQSNAEIRALFTEARWPPDPLTDLNHVGWAFREVTRAGGYDLIHAHSAAALALGSLLPELPVVYTLHHEREETLSDFYGHYPDAYYVAISADQRSREIALPHCHVIHHGLDSDRYQWRRGAADYVCFVGRFSRVKGPHTAMDVASAAGLPIRVAGEVHEPDRAFAERHVLPRLNLPHVEFLGCVGMAAKVPLLRDARALLAPIEWNEPFGLILIEAMLSGCPVIAYGRGSVPELVEPGVTGYIVGSAEEMAAVIRPGGVLDHFDRAACRARAVARHIEPIQRLDRTLGLALGGTKGGEVMLAHETSGTGAHPLQIERMARPGHLVVQQTTGSGAVGNEIAIGARPGAETRMKSGRDFPRPADADSVRQVCAGPHDPGAIRTLRESIEMHHLVGGVHTGVGTPGADESDFLCGHLRQGMLQDLLHRPHIPGLSLKAVKIRTVVLHGQGDALHPLRPRGIRKNFGVALVRVFSHLEWLVATPRNNKASCTRGHKALQNSVRDQLSMRLRSSSASLRCSSLPSSLTSERMSLAPSLSPMSM
jgi:glycosyltransferase involved in cell wall biosynthesis